VQTGRRLRLRLPRSFALDAAIAVAVALAIGLVGGHSLPDYDATFALIWARDIAHGSAPDYTLPFRPAGHPLTTLVALIG
jgi:hypothetical protein